MEKNDTILKPFVAENLFWIREPKQYTITDSLITIVSEPHTDLWQRTYYGFSNDNAPVLQMKTSDKFFSFTVKTSFNSSALFDQCVNRIRERGIPEIGQCGDKQRIFRLGYA